MPCLVRGHNRSLPNSGGRGPLPRPVGTGIRGQDNWRRKTNVTAAASNKAAKRGDCRQPPVVARFPKQGAPQDQTEERARKRAYQYRPYGFPLRVESPGHVIHTTPKMITSGKCGPPTPAQLYRLSPVPRGPARRNLVNSRPLVRIRLLARAAPKNSRTPAASGQDGLATAIAGVRSRSPETALASPEEPNAFRDESRGPAPKVGRGSGHARLLNDTGHYAATHP